MEQKIYEHHFRVSVNGTLEDLNLEALIKEVEGDGCVVKQISTCCVNKHFPSREQPDSYIYVFLLANKA